MSSRKAKTAPKRSREPTTKPLERLHGDIRKRTLEDVDKLTEVSRTRKAGAKRFKFSFMDKRRMRTAPEHSFIVTMFFANGTLKTFIVKTNKLTFKHNKKMYYLFYEESFYDISLASYHLFFMEHIAVPINREVQLVGDEAFFSATPENLQKLIDMQYVAKLAGSDSIDKWVRVLIILGAANLIGLILLGLQVWGG